MKVFREKCMSVLYILLAVVLIAIALLGDMENRCVVNMLYGAGGVLVLLIVARAICLFVNRKKLTCCTSSKSTEACCKDGESTETEACCKEGESAKKATCCCTSGRILNIVASLMLLIAFVLLAIKSTSTCCRITWGILGAITLCALVCGICRGCCKKGTCKN